MGIIIFSTMGGIYCIRIVVSRPAHTSIGAVNPAARGAGLTVVAPTRCRLSTSESPRSFEVPKDRAPMPTAYSRILTATAPFA